MKILLIPRRDQILRQLNRVGLKANQLSSEQLIKLFFDIYNRQDNNQEPKAISVEPVVLSNPQQTNKPTMIPTQPSSIPTPPPPSTQIPSQQVNRPIRNHPFVVEELTDNV